MTPIHRNRASLPAIAALAAGAIFVLLALAMNGTGMKILMGLVGFGLIAWGLRLRKQGPVMSGPASTDSTTNAPDNAAPGATVAVAPPGTAAATPSPAAGNADSASSRTPSGPPPTSSSTVDTTGRTERSTAGSSNANRPAISPTPVTTPTPASAAKPAPDATQAPTGGAAAMPVSEKAYREAYPSNWTGRGPTCIHCGNQDVKAGICQSCGARLFTA